MRRVHIVFRCDGNETVGAGHVGRCVPIALAVRRAGHEVTFVGNYSGVAAMLLDEGSFETRPPEAGPAGLPRGADGVLIDHYDIPDDELAAVSLTCPVVAVRDLDGSMTGGAIGLDYHLDASGVGLVGPDFAPVDPSFTACRHRPSGGPALVALGGSTAGCEILPAIIEGLVHGSDSAINVVGELRAAPSDRVRSLGRLPGLASELAQSSALICGAGVTAYEAACAGIPALLVVLADNQDRVGRAFSGLAPVLQARVPPSAEAIAAAVQALPQARIATAGPALVDGLGGARVREALLAAIDGRPFPAVQRYRPATPADSDLLLSWRNDPRVRAVSRETDAIAPATHRAWLTAALTNRDRTLLIVERSGAPVATVRFDRGPLEAAISITVAADRRGVGVGTQAIAEATELELAARPELQRVVAEVASGNEASIRSFGSSGYRPLPVTAERPGGWVRLEAVR
ncbi:MAG TPA: bifunctional UDP-2,4-diacetamido-2,4,6-trideoxy-beta-L-altropyranose hydrolase/GNAT family N-acetyltransferase [Solirubrobacteraceae bacterium]|nr:bifunctional UDP-2,4-diacetamido-2,4,6-trideoxy-beta-L-altropyranose hydrolase/GNAT family N-acetyltransferase [Solirubrobacteraceae bacterium]